AVAAAVGIGEVARNLNARVFMLGQRRLRSGERKDRTDLDTGGLSRRRCGCACGAGQTQPDGGELPKSHQRHSRSPGPGWVRVVRAIRTFMPGPWSCDP